MCFVVIKLYFILYQATLKILCRRRSRTEFMGIHMYVILRFVM